MLKNNKNQFSRMSLKDDLNLFKNNINSNNIRDDNCNNSGTSNAPIINHINNAVSSSGIATASILVTSPTIILPECSTANSILRHRRTNSKDLKNQNQSHQRNLSQHKIQIDPINLDSCNGEATQHLLKSTSQENLSSNELDTNQNV